MPVTADLGFVPDTSAPDLGFVPDKPAQQTDLGFVPDKYPGAFTDAEWQHVLHPPVFAESTGSGTLNFPSDLLKAKFPSHQWTPQEIAQEAKDEAAVDTEARPGLIQTLPRAIVADTAAGMMSAFDRGNRAQDADMFSGNIPAAFEGNPSPIDQIIKQESTDKDEIPAVTAAKISTGVANSAPWLATGFLGMPAWAGRLMALGFSAQMIASAGPAARTLGTELGKNPEDRDSDTISSAVSDLVQDFGFAPFAGLHGVAGNIPAVRDAYEKHFDQPMYVIRQLSDQLQNAPIARPFTDPILGVTPAPNAIGDLPDQAGPAKQLAQAPVSQKLDNLAAAVQDLQDMLRGRLPTQKQQTVNVPTDRADEIIRNIFPTEERLGEAADETTADRTSQPAQDATVSPSPIVSDRPAFSPSGESDLTPNKIQQSITEAINEKHAKATANASENNVGQRDPDVVRQQAKSAFSEVRQREGSVLANTAFAPEFYSTEIGRRIQTIAAHAGIRVIFYKGDPISPRGFFDPKDGRLYLRTDLPEFEMAGALEHEIFHKRVAAGDRAAQRVMAAVDLNRLQAQKIAARYNSWLLMQGKPPLTADKLREEIGAFHVSGQNYEGITPSDAFTDPVEALTAAREYHGATPTGNGPASGVGLQFAPGKNGDGGQPPTGAKLLGGAYKDIEAGIGQVHHMPAASVSTLSQALGPSIWMETADHFKTASHGRRGREGKVYRARQAALIEQGKFDEALQMDIDDIRYKFGTKYDEGIRQMLEYYKTIPRWMLKLMWKDGGL